MAGVAEVIIANKSYLAGHTKRGEGTGEHASLSPCPCTARTPSPVHCVAGSPTSNADFCVRSRREARSAGALYIHPSRMPIPHTYTPRVLKPRPALIHPPSPPDKQAHPRAFPGGRPPTTDFLAYFHASFWGLPTSHVLGVLGRAAACGSV